MESNNKNMWLMNDNIMKTGGNADGFDYESTINQALVNEGKHEKVLNMRRTPIQYSEKDLRDAAHAQVAQTGYPDEKGSRKRKHLNADEKARQSRDRNREHAKNTRLRKKAYVTKLRELVEEMTKQKDLEETQRKILGEKIHQQQLERKKAAQAFLDFRAGNVRDRTRWASILNEEIVLTLPITPYRSFRKSDIKNSCRIITGINAVIADTSSLAIMVESIGQGSTEWKDAMKRGNSCRLTYFITTEDNIAAGDLVICRFLCKIEGVEKVGGQSSCLHPGMLMCQFDSENKIIAAEIVFDVMGYMQQLQRASGMSPESSIIANTLEMALQPSREAQAIVKADAPFTVVHVNDAWTSTTGCSQSQAEGVPMALALGIYDFQLEPLFQLATECANGCPSSAKLMVNGFTQEARMRQPFYIQYVKLLPLTSDSEKNQNRISHFLLVLVDLPVTMEEIRTIIQRDNAGGAGSPQSSSSRYARSSFEGESVSRASSGDSTAYGKQFMYTTGNSMTSKPYSMNMLSYAPQSEGGNVMQNMQPMYAQPGGDFYAPSGSNIRRQISQVSSKSNKSNNSVDSISSVGIGSTGEEEQE